MRRRTVVFAGGGTGGHLFPGLAVARALTGCDVVFLVPHDRGDEARLRGQFPCIPMSCPRVDRGRVLLPVRMAAAVARARRILRRQGAGAVVGLGGYASVPAVLAARSLRLPVYLVECNAVPGRATRFLSRFAAGVGLASVGARDRLGADARFRLTGTPLRDELRARADPAEFGLESGRATLLVLGGSQGASGLNDRVTAGLAACADLPFQVIHATGARDGAEVRARYAAAGVTASVREFIPDVGRAYAAADLVLSRAGASTVAECLALGRPAVFVPYPHHADRQQAHNAWEAVRGGAATIIEEEELDPVAVRGVVEELLLDEARRAAMAGAAQSLARPEAARAMAAHVLESFGPAVGETQWIAELGG